LCVKHFVNFLRHKDEKQTNKTNPPILVLKRNMIVLRLSILSINYRPSSLVFWSNQYFCPRKFLVGIRAEFMIHESCHKVGILSPKQCEYTDRAHMQMATEDKGSLRITSGLVIPYLGI
jgi:hypothetical protein